MAGQASSVRIDVWTWSVRLYATRSAAAVACHGGHVRVNGTRVKAAHPVRTGDTVQARTPAGERIVIVTSLLSKRVGAAVAVHHYEDRSPPALPREERPAPISRAPGSGRPSKRDRRRLERLRGR